MFHKKIVSLNCLFNQDPMPHFFAPRLIKHLTLILFSFYGMHSSQAATGEIWASKYAVPVLASGLGETKILWTSSGTSNTQVWVSTGGPRTQFASAGASGNGLAPWIQQGIHYTFYLYEASGPLQADTLVVLDSVVVLGIAKIQPQVGMNRMDLHMQYYGSTSGCEWNQTAPCLSVAKRLAKRSIQDAKYMGVGYLRVAVADYYGDKWKSDSVNFWNEMDEMIADLKAANIKLVPSLLFNIHQFPQVLSSDMRTFVTDPNSASYQMAVGFITKFVKRYKNDPVIYFWELTNEMNLECDIDMYNYMNQDPLYTNFTSAEMYAFNKRITKLIRSLDDTHMITSGYAMPRKNATSLSILPGWLGGGGGTDNQSQYSKMLIDQNKYFDIACIHTYNGNNDNQRFGYTGLYNAGLMSLSKQITDAAKTLLYIGEFGDAVPNSLYDKTCQYSQNVLDKVQSDTIPFSSPWTLEFYQFTTYVENEFNIDPIHTTPLVNKLMNVNVALGNSPVPAVTPDVIPPICIIAFPLDGSSFVEPHDTIYPKASDNSLMINRIDLIIDGANHSSTSTWPFKMHVRTDSLPACDHQLIARAFDNAGNFTDDTITIFKTGIPCSIATAVNEQNRSAEIRLFPNPATDILNVSVAGDKIRSIQIFDAVGRELFPQHVSSSGKISLYTNTLTQGVYMLKVVCTESSYVKRFAKY